MAELPPDVVLALHDDGRVDVAGNADDQKLSTYLRDLADYIEAGKHRSDCEACASNTPHEHDDTSAPPE